MKCKALFLEKPGPLQDNLSFKQIDLAEPKENEVTIKYLASPINPSDYINGLGVYGSGATFPLFPGFEGVGEVTQLGSHVTSLKVGDRVLPRSSQGTWRTHANIEASKAITVDQHLSLPAAATLLINPPTAYFLLKSAGLQPGDFVIQNGATSAVGLTVIQLAKLWGFRTINVFRARSTPEANSRLVEEIKSAFGGDLFFTDKELSEKPELIREAVKQASGTSCARVPAAFDCVGGKDSEGLAQQLNPGGVLFVYGAMSGQPVTVSPLHMIFRNIQIKGYWVGPWLQDFSPEAASDVRAVFHEITQLYNSGQLKMPPHQEIQFSEAGWKAAFDGSLLRPTGTLPHKQMFIF